MNLRFTEMRALLERSCYFKLVCGAGNESAEEVRKLSVVYTLAGANGLDVSANPDIVKACVAGIEQAYELAPQMGLEISVRPFITVSVGMPGDHHVRKAFINPLSCIRCKSCIPACPANAITDNLVVIRALCIGCGHCESVCPAKVNAVDYEHNEQKLAEILPLCLKAGAENIELHAAVPGDEAIMKEWEIINEVQPNHFVSMCLDRLHLSNVHLIERIKKAAEIAGEHLLIQADGVPMSGGKDDFNTTLQAIAIADVIHKDLIQKERKYRYLPVLLSGGTNSWTAELARICGVSFNGISVGSYARKIVSKYVNDYSFDSDINILSSAVTIAEDLVERNLTACQGQAAMQ